MLKLYSIKDTKGAFMVPFVNQNDSLAVREVKTIVNGQKGSPVTLYPEDFELWCIGTFDEVTGIVAPGEMTCIVRLNALVNGYEDER